MSAEISVAAGSAQASPAEASPAEQRVEHALGEGAEGAGPAGLRSDRLNPILVKEVRQAFRGPYFARGYLLLLIAAGLAGVAALLSGLDDLDYDGLGRRLFVSQMIALSVGLSALLPVQAFQSMGSEREEHTLDLLLLSGLSPRRIVSGKLAAILSQGLLVLSAFLPLIALSYLARGVGLASILFMVAINCLASLLLCAAASFVSANSGKRLSRVIGIPAVAFAGCGAVMMQGAFMMEVVLNPGELDFEPEMLYALGVMVAAGLSVTWLLLAGARAGFTHVQNDALAGVRRATLGSCVALVATVVIGVLLPRIPDYMPRDVLIAGSLLLCPAFLFLLTDRSTNRSKGRSLGPSGGSHRLFGATLRAGAGSGALLLIVVALMIGGCTLFLRSRLPGATAYKVVLPLMPLAYTAFYVGIPALLLARWSATPEGRVRVRLIAVIFACACVAVPMMFGAVVGDYDLSGGEHWLNMVWAMSDSDDGVRATVTIGLVGALVVMPRALGVLQRPAPSTRSTSAGLEQRLEAAAEPSSVAETRSNDDGASEPPLG